MSEELFNTRTLAFVMLVFLAVPIAAQITALTGAAPRPSEGAQEIERVPLVRKVADPPEVREADTLPELP